VLYSDVAYSIRCVPLPAERASTAEFRHRGMDLDSIIARAFLIEAAHAGVWAPICLELPQWSAVCEMAAHRAADGLT